MVHGEAIALAPPGQFTADTLTEALDAGITLVACRNSMRSQNLQDADLVPSTVLVRAGAGHLVARQNARATTAARGEDRRGA